MINDLGPSGGYGLPNAKCENEGSSEYYLRHFAANVDANNRVKISVTAGPMKLRMNSAEIEKEVRRNFPVLSYEEIESGILWRKKRLHFVLEKMSLDQKSMVKVSTMVFNLYVRFRVKVVAVAL